MPIIVYIATSLDFYIASEDGGVGWLDLVDKEGEDYGYQEFYDTIEVTAMGRSTYEMGLKLHGGPPYPDKQTIVFSRSISEIEGATVEKDLITFAKDNRAKRVWIVGGGMVISKLLELDLIDEMMLFILPTTIGRGIPLFLPSDGKNIWHLQQTKTYDTGLVLLHYVRKDE